jgi:hypothetical protein
MRNDALGKMRSSTKVCDILGDSATSMGTVENWIAEIDGKKVNSKKETVPFVLLKFLKGNQKDKYTGLSDDAISALVVYEHSERQSAVHAT